MHNAALCFGILNSGRRQKGAGLGQRSFGAGHVAFFSLDNSGVACDLEQPVPGLSSIELHKAYFWADMCRIGLLVFLLGFVWLLKIWNMVFDLFISLFLEIWHFNSLVIHILIDSSNSLIQQCHLNSPHLLRNQTIHSYTHAETDCDLHICTFCPVTGHSTPHDLKPYIWEVQILSYD